MRKSYNLLSINKYELHYINIWNSRIKILHWSINEAKKDVNS